MGQPTRLAASPLYRGGRHTGVRSRRELAELLRLYDAEIRYTDHLVGHDVRIPEKKRLV